MLIVPNLEACRRLAELPAEAATTAVLADARVRDELQKLLDVLAAQATGSATRVTRALVLATPLSIDRGEVTDKGSLVQQAILRTQAALVARLYADDADHDPEIMRPRRPSRVQPA
jgi:feruloyl-CoA synthase